jgi:hypothetical protein
MKALESSLWFSAVNTLTEEECVSRFTMRRADLLHRYRRSADVAFSNADLINTTDLLLVQAYVVYLVSQICVTSSSLFFTFQETRHSTRNGRPNADLRREGHANLMKRMQRWS